MVSGEIKNDESEAILFEVQKLWEENLHLAKQI